MTPVARCTNDSVIIKLTIYFSTQVLQAAIFYYAIDWNEQHTDCCASLRALPAGWLQMLNLVRSVVPEERQWVH